MLNSWGQDNNINEINVTNIHSVTFEFEALVVTRVEYLPVSLFQDQRSGVIGVLSVLLLSLFQVCVKPE